VWYCGKEHQTRDWKAHKKACSDAFRADRYTLHKNEFDRIRKQYGLDSEEKAEEISEYLTNTDARCGKVSASDFTDKFGTTVEEAVVFLEWIKVGVKFKEETLDVAKKSGFPTMGGKGGDDKKR
jgi:hypothetical protein